MTRRQKHAAVGLALELVRIVVACVLLYLGGLAAIGVVGDMAR